MFPLGTVLLPHAFLPLHVFEPRYRALTRHCLQGDREFGVVLIERGSEVGGGDVRYGTGTVARILEAEELPDGRWVLATVGTRRVRVQQWLPDDPFPRAEVEDLEDRPSGAGARDRRATVEGLLRRVLALRTELDEPAAPATVTLDEDPGLATWQATLLGGLGPADAQRLLGMGTAEDRLRHLETLLTEQAEVLAHRLGGA